jgi:hypothetical protein
MGVSANRWPSLPMHEDLEHLVDHAEVIVALELLPHIDQILVQRIQTTRKEF